MNKIKNKWKLSSGVDSHLSDWLINVYIGRAL